jgi:hypothetical protein
MGRQSQGIDPAQVSAPNSQPWAFCDHVSMRRDGASRAGSVDNLAQRLAPGRLPESEKDLQSLGLC